MKIRLYTRGYCSWCLEAKEYLREHKIPFEEIDVGNVSGAFDEMKQLSGQRYVPTIVVDDRVLANFDVAQLEEFLDQVNRDKQPAKPEPPPAK